MNLLSVAALALTLLGHVSPGATTFEIDEGNPDSMAGSLYNLPIGPNVSEPHAAAWATGMPAVRAAMDYFRSRGYVPRPEYNRAANNSTPPATIVFLAFEKPGFVSEPGHLSAPVIAVHSVLTDAGVAKTTISSAFADVSLTTGLLSVIEPDGSGSGFDIPPDEIASVRTLDDLQPSWFGASGSAADTKFRKFAGCSALAASSALVNAALTPPPIPQRVIAQAAVVTAIGVATCAFSTW